MCEVLIDAGQSEFGFHRLESFIYCPRKFGFKEKLGITPKVLARALALGTAGHNALAAWKQDEDYKLVLRRADPSWAYVVPDIFGPVEYYIDLYKNETTQILAVEREFEIMIDGRKFTRRLDLVYYENGKAHVRDYKFTGIPDQRKYSNPDDPVLFTQHLVAQETFEHEFGVPFGHVMVDMISPKPPYKVVRHVPKFYPGRLTECRSTLSYWLQMTERFMKTDLPVPQWPASWQCEGKYSTCEYAVLCRFGFEYIDQFKVG